MSDMFLDPDEIRELTGRIQHRSQARELNHLGIIYKIRADGSVLVLRAHIEEVLGGSKSAARARPEAQINWDAVNEPARPRKKPK